jgi:hypothetical protein
MNLEDVLDFPYDPWILLGVPEETDDKTVKAAWKKAGSPDTGVLARAYEMLRNEESRIRTALLSPRPYSRAGDAAATLRKHPVFLGPGIWYDEIARNRET